MNITEVIPDMAGQTFSPSLGATGSIMPGAGGSPFDDLLNNYINSQSGILGIIPGMPTWAKALGSMKMGFSSGDSSFGINMGGGGTGGAMMPQIMSAMKGLMNQTASGMGQPVTISNSRAQTNPTTGTPTMGSSRFSPGIMDIASSFMDQAIARGSNMMGM